MERLCLLSFDKDLHYNANAVPVIFTYKHQNIRKKPKRLLYEMKVEAGKSET